VDSARILSQPGWAFDVVDVDAYGSPWAQWLGILAHAPSPITVILTIGSVRMMGGGNLPAECREALGLSFAKKCPMSLLGNINERHAIPLMLGLAPAHGWRIAESLEAPRGRKARYIGVRLERVPVSSSPLLPVPKSPRPSPTAPPPKKSSRVKN
jgi:hypothetical protein